MRITLLPASAMLAAALLLAGCAAGWNSLWQLSVFKEAAVEGDYVTIADRDMVCVEGDPGCNQAHLIKGDACFRLALADVTPGDPGRWDCAIRHLAIGIDMTAGSMTELGPIEPYYENLLEALRRRLDLSRSWAESAAFLAQLESRAQAFRNRFPTAPAGYYYLASARLPDALDTADQRPDEACRTLTDLQILLGRAPIERGRFEAGFRQIEAEIRAAKSTVRGCA